MPTVLPSVRPLCTDRIILTHPSGVSRVPLTDSILYTLRLLVHDILPFIFFMPTHHLIAIASGPKDILSSLGSYPLFSGAVSQASFRTIPDM